MKDRLIQQANELIEKKPLAYAMRHSLREPILDNRNPYDAMLTEEGREYARYFGTLLPIDRKVCFFSSPVERCVETASLIAAGFESEGGRVDFIRPFAPLAALYGSTMEQCLESVELLTPEGFFAEWAKQSAAVTDGDQDLGARLVVGKAKMFSLPEARRRMREAILAESIPGYLNIFLTHDYHLNILRKDYKKMAEVGYQWPNLLGGEIIDAEAFDMEYMND